MNEREQQLAVDRTENTNADPFLLDKLSKEIEGYQNQIKMLEKELDQRFSEIATLTQILLEKDKSITELEKHQIKNIPGVRYIKGPVRFFMKLLRLK